MADRRHARRGLWGAVLCTIAVTTSAVSSFGEQATTGAQRSQGRRASTDTQEMVSAETVAKKLDQVLEMQATILQRLDAVMEELRIIKVRATLRGS